MYELQLSVEDTRLIAAVDGETIFDVEDDRAPLLGGGIAVVCEEGRMDVIDIDVRPVRDE
jgi:hypothetical protein